MLNSLYLKQGVKQLGVHLFFYLLFCAIALGAGIGVFLLVRRFGTWRAGGAGFATVGVACLLFPIPIHGGFTTVLDAMLSEFGSQHRVRQQEIERDRKADFLLRQAERFRGYLAVDHRQELGRPGWSQVEAADQIGFLDIGNRLIWRESIPWTGTVAEDELPRAKQLCQAQEPQGYWALPNETELALFWEAGGLEVMPGQTVNAISFTTDAELQLELPTFHRSNRGEGRICCVALATGAPRHGYLKGDISLELWNRYQLAKLSGLTHRK